MSLTSNQICLKNMMDDRYVYITNTSVNKKSKWYVKNRAAEKSGYGSKWSPSAFRSYLTKNRLVEWSNVWTQARLLMGQ